MSSFNIELIKCLEDNQGNFFGKENYDELRFGKYSKPAHFLRKLEDLIGLLGGTISIKRLGSIKAYESGLQFLWERLNPDDQSLLVWIIAYRLLGFTKIKLPTNNQEYWKYLESCRNLFNENDSYDPHFQHFKLFKFNLAELGFDIKCYYTLKGVVAIFVLEQYAYRRNGQNQVAANEGDIVLDLGGCWGDTALYFAHCVGDTGKVYSFEFIPGNIHIHNKNTKLNPGLKERIMLVPNPVSSKSNVDIYYKDKGPASTLSEEPFDGYTGQTQTVAVDDFVVNHGLDKVDFIKMDIEGAEPIALIGAESTIRQFRPKLAISLYHSLDDFVSIPEWIDNLGLGYKLSIGHYTIHKEETILYATVR